jgi:hypothetical protein
MTTSTSCVTPQLSSQLGAARPGSIQTEPSISTIQVPADVQRLMDKMSFSLDDLLNIDKTDLTKICDLFEEDPLSRIGLKVHMLSLVKSIHVAKQAESLRVVIIVNVFTLAIVNLILLPI